MIKIIKDGQKEFTANVTPVDVSSHISWLISS